MKSKARKRVGGRRGRKKSFRGKPPQGKGRDGLNPLTKLGLGSLAVIIALGDGIITTLGGLMEGRSLTVGRAYDRALKSRGFREYYEELKGIKKNGGRVILHRLQKKGLVGKKGKKLSLTGLGATYYKQLRDEVEARETWDGKWRIVMFDIPEKIRKEREWLKSQLYLRGYKPFQKSVLVGKLPISEELFKELDRRRIKHCVNLITVGEIDDEEILESFD